MIGFATLQFVLSFVSFQILAQESNVTDLGPTPTLPADSATQPRIVLPTGSGSSLSQILGTSVGEAINLSATDSTFQPDRGIDHPNDPSPDFDPSASASSETAPSQSDSYRLTPGDVDQAPWSVIKSATDMSKCLLAPRDPPQQYDSIQ